MTPEAEARLLKVKDFAAKAHSGQERKYSSEHYINHPVRVMCMLEAYTSNEAVLAAALLHDVLEDTDVTKEKLAEFLFDTMSRECAAQTIRLVDELTDVYVKEDYPQWNRSKRRQMELKRLETTSAQSQTIRYADIIDNCSQIVEVDPEFAETFLNECLSLLKKNTRGERSLYDRAMEMVQNGIEKLKAISRQP